MAIVVHLLLLLKKLLSDLQRFQNDREAEMSVTQYNGTNPRRQTSTTKGYKRIGPTI